MKEDNIQEDINLNISEIGYIAKLIDQEMTIYERMKLKKTTLVRITGAMMVYLVTMSAFAILL